MKQQGWNHSMPQEILVATQLQQLVQNKEYDQIAKLLDKITIKDKGVLGVEECKHEGMGDRSKLKVTLQNGHSYNDDCIDFWDDIYAENSPQGAWQVFLLSQLWTYLPLFWHDNYEHRDYIYTNEQLAIIVTKPDIKGQPIENFDSTKYDVTPHITKSEEDKYVIHTCYWSDFEGLVREEFRLSISEKGEISFWPSRKKILFQYNCGICF